jgi:hypothetical protein
VPRESKSSSIFFRHLGKDRDISGRGVPRFNPKSELPHHWFSSFRYRKNFADSTSKGLEARVIHRFDTHQGYHRSTARHSELNRCVLLSPPLSGRLVKENQIVSPEDAPLDWFLRAQRKNQVNPILALRVRCHRPRWFGQTRGSFLGRAGLTLGPSLHGKHEFLTSASKNFYSPCKHYTPSVSYTPASHVGGFEDKISRLRTLVTNSTNTVRIPLAGARKLPNLNAAKACTNLHNVTPICRWPSSLVGYDISTRTLSIPGWAVARSPRSHIEAEE